MWLTLTSAHVKSSISPMELAAFTAIAETSGGADPMTNAIARAVGKVRSAVAGNDKNRLGQAGTIPDELLSEACDLAAWYIVTAPGIKLSSSLIEVREKKKDDAMSELDKVASDKRRIVPPDDAASSQPSGPGIAVVTPSRTKNDVCSQSGLL